MRLLKTLNRYMERNQAARIAVLELLDQASIVDMDTFDERLWFTIKSSQVSDYSLEIVNSDDINYEFLVKLLIKMGFPSEHAARMLMRLDRRGFLVLAMADEESLRCVERYIKAQANAHSLYVSTRIKKMG